MILLTGGNGLVANGVKMAANDDELKHLYFANRGDADLESYEECKILFEKVKPSMVVHLAAYVGGLFHNMRQPVDFFEKNMLMQINVMRCCHKYKVKRVITCLSTCIFPDKVSYPIVEDTLHDGKPHDSNFSYAYAKRMGEVLNRAYEKQYGMECISICPTNVFGPYDNFSLENGHVVPALIHRCHIYKRLSVWGSGKPLREFIYNVDLGKIILKLIHKKQVHAKVLICSPGVEISIGDVAKSIADKFGKSLSFDVSKSDGQFKKNTSNDLLKKELGDIEFTDFVYAIGETVDWFIKNYEVCRK